MLKRYAVFFSVFRSLIDIAVISGGWFAVYYLRFHSGFFASPKGIPDFTDHLKLAIPITCICLLGCLWAGFYKPKRIEHGFKQFGEVLRATILNGLLVFAVIYNIEDNRYSRSLLIMFIVVIFIGFILSHVSTRAFLRILRRKGYNLRYYVVIGAGKKGQLLVRDVEKMTWLGLKCRFFIDDNPDRIGSEIMGIPVLGPIAKLPELMTARKVDEVYLALSGAEAQRVYSILESLQCAGTTIRIIPDWGNLISISSAIAIPIGTQVLFSAADSPLTGVNIVIKEVFDRTIAAALLLAMSIPMTIIALMVKLTSKGPIFYKQARIGIDQKQFSILKFRTMTVDADKNGPQWTVENDPRTTTIGRFLRATSIDELPQIINVLKGEMSLVGPRPEQPHFVKQFSEEYRKYMLRHKIKAGMTGWAQICGFRGDTSLKKRLQYDLYYIRNWSIGFDTRILLLTPWRIIKGENAY